MLFLKDDLKFFSICLPLSPTTQGCSTSSPAQLPTLLLKPPTAYSSDSHSLPTPFLFSGLQTQTQTQGPLLKVGFQQAGDVLYPPRFLTSGCFNEWLREILIAPTPSLSFPCTTPQNILPWKRVLRLLCTQGFKTKLPDSACPLPVSN